jgi:hypothetical protein
MDLLLKAFIQYLEERGFEICEYGDEDWGDDWQPTDAEDRDKLISNFLKDRR